MSEQIQAADFNEPHEVYGISEIASGYTTFSRRMRQAAIETLGDLDARFTDAEELAMATTIQAGHAAEADLAKQRKPNDARDVRLHNAVAAGREAQQTLVMANLRFAAYYARASMNITPGRTRRGADSSVPILSPADEPDLSVRTAVLGAGKDVRPRAGAYADIRVLANPHANLDDRTQVAMEALIEAAASYTAKTDKNNKQVTFRSHMGYRIHSALSDYAKTLERAGWLLGQDDIGMFSRAERHPEDFRPERVAELRRRVAGSDAISLDAAVLHKQAPDEYESDWYPQEPLTLADTYADPANQRIAQQASQQTLYTVIGSILETLSERESGVLRLKHGIDLSKEATYHGELHTLNEIAQIYGVTRERARQIESKVMGKLREPSRGLVLQKAYELYLQRDVWWGTEDQVTPFIPETTSPLRTEQSIGAAAMRNRLAFSIEHIDTALAGTAKPGIPRPDTWDDDWDQPSRLTDEQLTSNYERITSEFQKLLYRSGDYHFQRSFAQAMGSEYPKGLERIINERLGTDLTAGHLEVFWNEELEPFIEVMQRRLGDDFDIQRISSLWSRLVSDRLRDQDVVTITIPETLDGKLALIGAWQQRGTLRVRGNVGELAGYGIGGIAELYIDGSVGDFAANRASRYANMHVSGDAGAFFGAESRGGVYLKVGGSVGDNCAYSFTGPDSLMVIEGGAGTNVAELAHDAEIIIGGKPVKLNR